MSATQTEELESFSAGVLEEISPFTVAFDETTTTKRTAKTGATYDSYNIVVKSARYTNRLRIVGVSKDTYERMRLLRLQGLKNLTVTKGVPKKESGFAPLIVSGVSA